MEMIKASQTNTNRDFAEFFTPLRYNSAENPNNSVSPLAVSARGCVSQWRGLKVLRFRKNQSIKAIIFEERVSDADFGKGGAHQILSVAQIALIVDPPGDNLLPIERRIISVDIFGDRLGNITSVFDA